MSDALRRAIVFWITTFVIISFIYAYIEHLAINKIPNFHSTYSDVFVIGGILTFVSLGSTFLLFLWLVHLIRKSDRTVANLIRTNSILFVSSLIALYITAQLAASWVDGLYYVGFYSLSFSAIMNFYFQRESRLT